MAIELGATTHKVLLIGVGNVFRCDDAVGLHIVRRLSERLPALVRVCEDTGDGAHLMDLWRNEEKVIVVDAVKSGARAGTVHRIDVTETPIPAQWKHDGFGVRIAEEIENMSSEDSLPAEAESFSRLRGSR